MAATTKAPDATEYGGDEISALVLDPGYASTRAGFAGEDVPKSVVPTHYGVRTNDNGSERRLFGDNVVHTPLPGLQIRNCMAKDGTVQDWETAAQLWEYGITSKLTSTSAGRFNGLHHKETSDGDVAMNEQSESEKLLAEHALLMTEPAWNNGKDREKGIEIAMESWGVPAYWLARNPVLAAFSAGKPSALVIDIGASSMSVSPIHDGLLLRKGVVRSSLGGDFLSNQVRLLFSSNSVPLTPHYLVASKQSVAAGAAAQAIMRSFAPNEIPHPSFRAFQEERVLSEFKESVVAVWPGPGRLSNPAPNGVPYIDHVQQQYPARSFETPEGYSRAFSAADRFRCAEGLFDAKSALTDATNPAPQQNQTIVDMIKQSLNAVDTDIKPHLLAQVIVTGGGSLIQGLNERLLAELQIAFQGMKIRIHSPGNLAERKFGGWIGGSILASLGTFHQMWISRKEYDEVGSSIVEKRCR